MRSNLVRLTFSTLFALTLGACGGDDDDPTTTNNDTSATDPSTGTDPTTTASTTMTTTTVSTTMTTDDTDPTDPTGSTDPTDATSSSGPDPDSSGSSGGTTGGDICAAEGDDDECTACTKGMCCDELTACYENANCQCVVLCAQAYLAEHAGDEPPPTPEMAVGVCTMGEDAMCDAIGAEDGPLIFGLNGCVGTSCAAECGGGK